MTTLPYAVWQVSEDKELKLRLTSLQATKVEEKIGVNLLKVFMPAEGESFALPPLKVMLLLTHGALQKYEHGISFEDVSDLYDSYVDNGGDQAAFYGRCCLADASSIGFYATGGEKQEESSQKIQSQNGSNRLEETTVHSVKEMVERLYPMFLDIGGKPLDFWGFNHIRNQRHD